MPPCHSADWAEPFRMAPQPGGLGQLTAVRCGSLIGGSETSRGFDWAASTPFLQDSRPWAAA
jgi:hypothetical protein